MERRESAVPIRRGGRNERVETQNPIFGRFRRGVQRLSIIAHSSATIAGAASLAAAPSLLINSSYSGQ
jgi:hypothetical protein